MQTDFLIIGQGLAGSLLAWELIQRGCKIVIVDSGKENASSIAAGIINPITGMRFVKTADVETLLPCALDCYAQLSEFFDQPFYINKLIFRIFKDEIELVHCQKRKLQAEYLAYLGDIFKSDHQLTGFSTTFGFIEQNQTGHVLTIPLLTQLEQLFRERNSYRQAIVDYPALIFDSGVRWQDIAAKQVIFCEGHEASKNPWFSWLPLQPAKGEILTLSHESELPDAILNYGNWLLPLTSESARIGATFNRGQLDNERSEQGKKTLLNALKPYSPSLARSTIVGHQAGIRPCTEDRFPLIGKLPHNDRINIFNGFGAKGSLQIPWYSQRFADYLIHDVPLPSTCDIHRYHASHFSG
jgi:glycine/D-amino acid oxidase-like deaminating enzyme